MIRQSGKSSIQVFIIKTKNRKAGFRIFSDSSGLPFYCLLEGFDMGKKCLKKCVKKENEHEFQMDQTLVYVSGCGSITLSAGCV
jgi:hypothetical protein